LPGSLIEAISECKESEIAKAALGKETFEKYIHLKLKEWDDYRMEVFPWELERYLSA